MSALANEPTRAELDLAREAFDRSGVGLVVINPEGVFRTVNRSFCVMLGYEPAEIEGQSFRRFTHPDDISRDEEALRQIRNGVDLLGVVDKRFIRKGGGEVWVRRSATVVRRAQWMVYQDEDHETWSGQGYATAVLAPSEVSIPGLDIREPVFRVRVGLDREYVEAYGARVPLQAGMLLSADIVFDRRSLVEWLFDPIYAVRHRS